LSLSKPTAFDGSTEASASDSAELIEASAEPLAEVKLRPRGG
jgi:hypothetical protein